MAQFFFPLSALVSVTALAVCGCTQHHTPVYADPSAANFLLDALAKQIGSGLPVESDPLGLKVDAVPAADTVRLHCRLTNISHEPITLDRLKLPCVGWWSLTVLGVTTDGRVLPQSVGVGSFLGPADHRQLPFSRLRPLRLKWRCSPLPARCQSAGCRRAIALELFSRRARDHRNHAASPEVLTYLMCAI